MCYSYDVNPRKSRRYCTIYHEKRFKHEMTKKITLYNYIEIVNDDGALHNKQTKMPHTLYTRASRDRG